MHYFDTFGWYTTEQLPGRSTAIAPDNLSTTEVEGELRANFTGHKWVMLPFSLPVPPPPVLPTVEDFDTALTDHFDRLAHEQRWGRQQRDARISLIARAGYPNPWQQVAIDFGTWMDTCNAMAYTLLAEVQAGTRPMPTSTQALIDVMPAMVWPEV